MATRWYDASIPIRAGITVWPGDPEPGVSAVTRMAQGASCNVSRLTLGTHTGTHIDAPWHVIDDGPGIDGLDVALFFGAAWLVDAGGERQIRPEMLGGSPLPRRLLIKTSASRVACDAPFASEYPCITHDTAQRIVDEGVMLVGIDSLSIGANDESGEETHRRLLANNVIVVEGLRLEPFTQGACLFCVLPLPLVGVDGAPCRAFVGLEEERG